MPLILLRKNLLKIALIAVGGIGIVYISKPDRGGLGRCEEIFELDSLEQRGVKLRPLLKWKPFENPKFRMKVEKGKADDLINYLAGCGYEEWKRGGVQYGSLNMGWDSSIDMHYSMRRLGKHVHIMAHDRTNHLVYAIFSQ